MDSFVQNPVLPALSAALLWALSAPLISRGLAEARRCADPVGSVLVGLTLATLTGALLLTALRGLPDSAALGSPYVLAAGLLTFPVGTGLYYVAAVKFANRAALAAQFANVKPVITIGFGLALFGETLSFGSALSAALILVGIGIILHGARARHAPPAAVGFGLVFATAWGLGEVFVRLGALDLARFDIAHAALVLSLPFALAALAAYGLWRPGRLAFPAPALLTVFAGHGALSFAGAYFLFFASISTHGLSHTVLITTFWPMLALLVSWLFDRNTVRDLGTEVIASMALFTLGALLHVASVWQAGG